MSAYPRRASEKEVARRAAEEMKRREDILCSDKPLRVFTDLVSRQIPDVKGPGPRQLLHSTPIHYPIVNPEERSTLLAVISA
jgi:hypothetical protein